MQGKGLGANFELPVAENKSLGDWNNGIWRDWLMSVAVRWSQAPPTGTLLAKHALPGRFDGAVGEG